jgi:hypothetical protein
VDLKARIDHMALFENVIDKKKVNNEILKAVKLREKRLAKGKPKGSDAPDFVPPVGLGPLTEKQYSHLRRIVMEEAEPMSAAKKTLRDYLISKYTSSTLTMTKREANWVIDRVVDWLQNATITITFPADKMFAGGPEPAWGTKYKPTAELHRSEVGSGELMGKEGTTFSLVGSDVGAYQAERGPNYMRWRRDKDAQLTKSAGFLPSELPSFGAINVSFDFSSGGTNYYGKTHFVLSPTIKQRSVFTAGSHGTERRSMLMLLADIPTSKVPKYMNTLIHHALGGKVCGDEKAVDLEVHVYGDLDLSQEFDAVSVPTDLDGKILNNVKTFAKKYKMKTLPFDPQKMAGVLDCILGDALKILEEKLRPPPKKRGFSSLFGKKD